MSPQPWGPMVERRKTMRYDPARAPASPLAAPFPHDRRRRRAVLGNPSLAVDLLACAFLLSLAFLGWLAT